MQNIMTPNTQQIKSALRWLITVFGATLAGWFASKGWINEQQFTAAINSPAFFSFMVSAIGLILSLITHKETNTIAVVDAMAKDPLSPVKGVIVEPTVAGSAIVEEMPGTTTVLAGSTEAAKLAGFTSPPM